MKRGATLTTYTPQRWNVWLIRSKIGSFLEILVKIEPDFERCGDLAGSADHEYFGWVIGSDGAAN